MTLEDWGWTPALAAAYAAVATDGAEPARVVCELRRKFYAVQTASGEFLGECRSGFFHTARGPEQFPAVGDWVVVSVRPDRSRADIVSVLPRRTKFCRRAAGSEDIQQIIATNIDTVFLVSGLDRNYNPKRLQRFLVAANESGAEPVVLLNKSDLCEDAEEVRKEVAEFLPGVPVFVTSSETRKGLKALVSQYIRPGRTVAFIGSSGVGKSSLINVLTRDDSLPTAEVREKDSKGRHTTTRRELVVTPSGALVIDTPGMRELQFWSIEGGVDEAFRDIAELALRCKFTNCTHTKEAGCAVLPAIASGDLDEDRLDYYNQLRAEKAASAPQKKKPSALASKPGWKQQAEGRKPFRHQQYREE